MFDFELALFPLKTPLQVIQTSFQLLLFYLTAIEASLSPFHCQLLYSRTPLMKICWTVESPILFPTNFDSWIIWIDYSKPESLGISKFCLSSYLFKFK